MRVRRDQLQLTAAKGSGSQGTIYGVLHGDELGFAFPLIYKEFSPGTAVSGAALEIMAAFRDGLADKERAVIDAMTVWPCAVVDEAGRVCGYLMQEIPARFLQPIAMMTGSDSIPREIQHLFVADDLARRNLGETANRTERLALCREMAFIFGFLHAHDLIFGDLSYKNAVYTLRPKPSVMLLDCDAVRMKGQGSAVPQLNSPGWKAPEGGPQTKDTDRYKLGLFILRTLTPGVNAQNRDPAKAAAVLDAPGMQLLRRSLADDAPARTSGKEWVEYFDAVIAAHGGIVERTKLAPPPRKPNVKRETMTQRNRYSPRPARVTYSMPVHAVHVVPPRQGSRIGPRPTPQPWVQPHRMNPSHVHTARPFGSGWSTAPPQPMTQKATRVAVAALAVLIGLFVVTALIASTGATKSTSTASTVPTSRSSTGTATGGATSGASGASSAQWIDNANATAAVAIAKINDPDWYLVSMSLSDAFAAPGNLDAFTTKLYADPPAWNAQFANRLVDDSPGTATIRSVIATHNGAASERDAQEVPRPTGHPLPLPLPSDWATSLHTAMATVANPTRLTEQVDYGWRCDPEATSVTDCVWVFRFRTSGGTIETVFTSAFGRSVMNVPAWYKK